MSGIYQVSVNTFPDVTLSETVHEKVALSERLQ